MVDFKSSGQAVGEATIRDHQKKDDIARACSQSGNFEKASKLYQENLTWSRKALGPRDPTTLDDQELLSFNLHKAGRYKQAEVLNRLTLRIRRQDQGNGHPETLETQHRLAFDIFMLGRYNEAAELDRQTLNAREKRLGPEDQESLSSRHNLAASLQELKRYSEAADLNRKTLKVREKKCGKDDNDLIASRHNLATNLYGLSQFDDAVILLRKNIEDLKKKRKADDPQLVRNEDSLDINLKALSRVRDVKHGKESDDGKRREGSDTKALRGPYVLGQGDTAEGTVESIKGRHSVTDEDRKRRDDSPRHINPKPVLTTVQGKSSETSACTETKRSRDINHERFETEKPQGSSTRSKKTGPTLLGNAESKSFGSTGSPISGPKEASSASEMVVPQSTRIKSISTPTINVRADEHHAERAGKGRPREDGLVQLRCDTY